MFFTPISKMDWILNLFMLFIPDLQETDVFLRVEAFWSQLNFCEFSPAFFAHFKKNIQIYDYEFVKSNKMAN